ncbi:exocyst complex component 3-like protein 2 isoform X2 [Hippopotamus amphibius kiboko]|uniref:exocyst complex component 3-like protein 2 isoform X2 n=1 Tax=Hippopotamus amphibius kiboko TaxID=575201 RepID=UPI0025985B7E|nr:exocyst complex component 3-like protein 2 isoform X2 [Hippopotamus amphibius kiboko]
MPILKSLGVADSKVPRAGTLPLRSSRNPFEEVSGLEEEEAGELGTLPNGTSCHRRATLEKLAGLATFRLGRAPGRRAGSPGDGQLRSFLGRVLTPGIRRSSADFGFLARLQGTRAQGDEQAAGEAARRLAFLRLGRGPKPQPRRASLAERVVPAGEAAPEPPPKVPEPPKMKEPLSVLEILSLIQQRELARADEHILELEAEELASSGGSAPGPPKAEGAGGGRRARDVALLYEALQRELWALVRETLAGPGLGAGAVAQLGQVLVQEEAADGRRGPEAARKLRARWAEAVARAARERLEAAAPGATGGLAGQLEALRGRLLEDLGVVRGRLAPSYPAGLGAFGVYLRGYHGALAEWIGVAARRRLPLADRYALLHWHNQVYPREVLGLVDMVALENGELGPLLSPGTLRGLEDECVTDVKAQTRAALLRVLQEDEEHWASTEDWSSGLAQDVCELLEEHTERAPRISQEFGERMAYCCLGGLAEFLQSFQQRVERFHENPGVRELLPDTYISRTISLVNCGPPLRALAERLARVGPPESEPAREAAASALERVTRLCHRILTNLLFQELQPHFSKLMRRKWLSSSEALDGIVGTLGAKALALRRMQDEPYQALVAELHRRALVEYVRPLFRGRLSCGSARTRNRVAGRLREDAAQLQRLFRRLESQASWLDAVVPRLAEVLHLEDTPSIQMEVGMLVRDYPDIRRKHVAALLDIRGLRHTATRHEILAVARDLELSEGGALSPPRDRAFFADIPVPRPPFCLSLPLFLGRLPLSRLACLPRRRPGSPSPSRPRAQC